MFPPKWFYTIPLRFRSVFRRKSVEQELDDELQFHLQQRTEHYIRDGMSRVEAEQAAREKFGSVIITSHFPSIRVIERDAASPTSPATPTAIRSSSVA